MEESCPQIKISELYHLFKLISEFQIPRFIDPDSFNDEIEDFNKTLKQDLHTINSDYQKIYLAFQNKDWKEVQKWLFAIRATSMGISSDFDNLRIDIEKVCEAIENKEFNRKLTWKKLDNW